MTSPTLAKMLAEDIDVGLFRVKCKTGLTAMHKGRSHRKRELHVSDFTASEKQFCYRKLVLRYFKGDERPDGGASWVEYDGKFREEKWKRLFEAAGILRGYQEELRIGLLSGHPDFTVDYGKGETVVELTGHDGKIDPILRNARLSVKKRQCMTYVIMRWYLRKGKSRKRGLVVVEDKGNNEFQVYPVDWDEERAVAMMRRVVRITKLLRAMSAATPERRTEIFRRIPKCVRLRCVVCGHGQ